MKKSVLFLALLLMVSLGGCVDNEDLRDTITTGTWRVDYYLDNGDERTSLFSGYQFAFLADGTVTVTRAGTAPVQGTWDEFDDDRRFDLVFGGEWPLEKLDERWVVEIVEDHEIDMHKLDSVRTQLRWEQI